MIRLFIDNTEVALSESTSFKYYRHNPFADKKGDYTYDIDVNLNNKNNAFLYRDLANVNGKFSIKNRNALLLDGAKVICRGTEVILSLENNIAKIQIVAGESELNYLIGDDTSVRDLDLPDLGEPSLSDASWNMVASFPLHNYTYPLFHDKEFTDTDSQKGNHGWNVFYRENGVLDTFVHDEELRLCKCPFLLYVVESVIKALGYEIERDELAEGNSKWRLLLMFNTLGATSVAKMLPDWTVKQFITEVENFFNCVILCQNGKASILSYDTYYSQNQLEEIGSESLLSEYAVETSEDDVVLQLSDCDISYKLGSNDYFKYANIPDDNMEQLENKTVMYRAIVPSEEEAKKQCIYKDPNEGFLYAVYKYSRWDGSDEYGYQQCNQFQSYVKGKSGIELGITPVDVRIDVAMGRYGLFPRSYVASTNKIGMSAEDIILNGYKDSVTDKIEVAFYLGMRRPIYSGLEEQKDMAQCFTTKYICGIYFVTELGYYKMNSEDFNFYTGQTLELLGEDGRVATDYKNRLQVDTKSCYKIRFLANKILDPAKLFLINGRRFVCVKLEYDYKNLQLSDIVEGEFYPIIETIAQVVTWSYYTNVMVTREGNVLTFNYTKVTPADMNKDGSIVIKINGTILPIKNGDSITISEDTHVEINYVSDINGNSSSYENTFSYQSPVEVYSYYNSVGVRQNDNSLTISFTKVVPSGANKEGNIICSINGVVTSVENGSVINMSTNTSVEISYTSDEDGGVGMFSGSYEYVEPKFYEEVDYIASAHYQKKGFINTNWIPKITDKTYIEGEIFSGLSTRNACGVYTYYRLAWTYTSGNDFVKVYAQSSNTPTTTPLEIAVERSSSTGIKTPVHISGVISKPTSTINGVTTQTDVTRTSNYSYPFFIFNVSNSKDTETGLWRVYSGNACATFHLESIKVKNANDELIHDWVPVRLLRDLVEGEYDEMTLSGTKQGDYGLVDKVTGIYYSCWVESDEQLIIGGNY